MQETPLPHTKNTPLEQPRGVSLQRQGELYPVAPSLSQMALQVSRKAGQVSDEPLEQVVLMKTEPQGVATPVQYPEAVARRGAPLRRTTGWTARSKRKSN